ncbi:uncharacterized protein LOC124498577 isoform X1 [Dermatophagoides farinae]|uniref:uncharacterized protein LOC124498577 isoform X1 n=1 Tax=Dermatophagoides farinae TaxID=6954 RepID=UPI003F615BF8
MFAKQSSMPSTLKASLLLLLLLQLNFCYLNAIDCFRCTSFGGANQWCEDPFHNNYSSTILQSPCWTGRKGRDGLYPATACIKLNGRFGMYKFIIIISINNGFQQFFSEDNGETMIVRDCALDSGSLTTDTELVRMSHCGGFYFDNRYVKGCVQSCSENACNQASSLCGQINYTILFTLFLSFVLQNPISSINMEI